MGRRAHNRMVSQESRAPLSRFLTVSDTAEVLNLTESAVLALLESGELPAIRLGSEGVWRIERTVLESYIDALYEESRRHSLWMGSDFANLPELSGGKIIRPDAEA